MGGARRAPGWCPPRRLSGVGFSGEAWDSACGCGKTTPRRCGMSGQGSGARRCRWSGSPPSPDNLPLKAGRPAVRAPGMIPISGEAAARARPDGSGCPAKGSGARCRRWRSSPCDPGNPRAPRAGGIRTGERVRMRTGRALPRGAGARPRRRRASPRRSPIRVRAAATGRHRRADARPGPMTGDPARSAALAPIASGAWRASIRSHCAPERPTGTTAGRMPQMMRGA